MKWILDDDRQAVSISGKFEVLLDDGQVATIEIHGLSLDDTRHRHTELALGVDHPYLRQENYASLIIQPINTGPAYMTVNAKLAGLDQDALYTIKTPPAREA